MTFQKICVGKYDLLPNFDENQKKKKKKKVCTFQALVFTSLKLLKLWQKLYCRPVCPDQPEQYDLSGNI